MIKQCNECEQPAVGRLDNEGDHDWLVCAEHMLTARREGNEVEQLEPRHDLVARVRASISDRLYDQSTLEGQLALNLAVDKLQEQKRQAGTSPRCKWDGQPCALQNCEEKGCYLDSRYRTLVGDDPNKVCDSAIADHPDSLACTLRRGHDGQHIRGWGPSAIRWGEAKP